MKVYSPSTPCVKCDARDATTKYVPATLIPGDFDKMRRTCRCCGYDWIEHPLDSGKGEPNGLRWRDITTGATGVWHEPSRVDHWVHACPHPEFAGSERILSTTLETCGMCGAQKPKTLP